MVKQVMDPRGILNRALIKLAIDLSTPTINAFFEVSEPETVWGPKFIVIAVVHPALQGPIFQIIGNTSDWQEEWGNLEEYKEIALWKARTAQKEGKPTSELVLQYPWDLKDGSFLYPGGVVAGKLGVGGSGIIGFADEGAANVVLSMIMSLSKLKCSQLREDDFGQLIEK